MSLDTLRMAPSFAPSNARNSAGLLALVGGRTLVANPPTRSCFFKLQDNNKCAVSASAGGGRKSGFFQVKCTGFPNSHSVSPYHSKDKDPFLDLHTDVSML